MMFVVEAEDEGSVSGDRMGKADINILSICGRTITSIVSRWTFAFVIETIRSFDAVRSGVQDKARVLSAHKLFISTHATKREKRLEKPNKGRTDGLRVRTRPSTSGANHV